MYTSKELSKKIAETGFKDKDLQLLMFDKRIDFSGEKKITFSSSYYCWNFLDKQIVMRELNKLT